MHQPTILKSWFRNLATFTANLSKANEGTPSRILLSADVLLLHETLSRLVEGSGWTCHEMWGALFTAVSSMDLDAYPSTHPVDLRSILQDICTELGKLPITETRTMGVEGVQMPSMEILQIMWWIMFPLLFNKAYK